MPRCRTSLLLVALLSAVAKLAWCGVPAWTEIGPPLFKGTAVFDPASQRLFALGSSDSRVWVLDQSNPSQSTQWSVLSVVGAPPLRADGYAFIDVPRNRLLLYGDRANPANHDVWALPLSGVPQWTSVLVQGAPPDRMRPGAIFDPATNRLVLFGGQTPGSGSALAYHNDVWSADLGGAGAWQLVSASGAPPGGRADASAVYDSRRHRMVFFGGRGPDAGSTILTWRDLWSLTLDDPPTWSPIPADSMGADLINGRVAMYDSTGDALVVDGSDPFTIVGPEIIPAERNQIWTVSLAGGSIAWHTLFSSEIGVGGFARTGALAALDDAHRRLLIPGGVRWHSTSSSASWNEYRADTWQFGLETRASAVVPGAGEIPSPRLGATLTFDPVGKQFYLFGGAKEKAVVLGDLWVVSDSTDAAWRLDSALGPSARQGHSAVYDPIRHRILIFGGQSSGGGVFNDVWALTPGSPNSWSSVATSGVPPAARFNHSAVYDPIQDRMIVFGGNNNTSDLNDTWVLSFAVAPPTWSNVPGPAPPAMSGQGAVFDPRRQRMVVFSGNQGAWALDLTGTPAWSEWKYDSPFGSFPASYDSASDNALQYAGGSETTVRNDIRATRLDGSLARIALVPPGSTYRVLHAQAFDPADRILLGGFGLQGGSVRHRYFLQDLRKVNLEDPATPALAALVSAAADGNAVTVIWALGTPAVVRVERRSVSSAWEDQGLATPDGAGRLTYRDEDVVAGATYDYRLNVAGVYAGFVSVHVPATPGPPELALLGAFPNPSPSGLSVSFRLPDAAPARLDLVDVRGRILAREEVGPLGAGAHSRRLVPPHGIASGLYFVRLTRGPDQITKRVGLLGAP